MKIFNKNIGNKYPPFIIAEAGLIHEGSLGIALKFIENASKCRADAVKFQMHIAEYESSSHEKFRINFSKQDETRFEYWKRTAFNFNQWKIIANYCKKKSIIFLCSPFSTAAVDQLIKLKVSAWKIASGETENSFLLNYIKLKSNRPLILSTGLSTLSDISKALKNSSINNNYILLQCNSKYPTPINDVGHKYISILKEKFNCPAGISDHSGSLDSLKMSVTLNANIIETHVSFSKNFYGPDISSSITFEDLSNLVDFKDNFYITQYSKYSKNKLTPNTKRIKKIFTQSLTFNKDLKKNHKISFQDLESRKPLVGFPSSNFNEVINKILIKNVKKNQFIKRNNFK